jgi:gamma-glutamyltranspeptidase/glutathione hydrolase
MRLASADRSRWRGDPAVFGIPARGLASPEYAAARSRLLDTDPSDSLPEAGDPWAADRATPSPACARLEGYAASPLGRERAAAPPSRTGTNDEASFTSHFSVVDADRNAVAVTFTVGVAFGSGVYVNGYFLNSGGGNFDRGTRGPSRFANSTVAPTIALEGNDVRLVVGAAGSQYIPTAVSQVVWRTLVLGEDPWLAIAAPRLQPARGKVVEVENGFAPAVYDALSRRGYRPVSRIGDLMFGGIHAVVATRNGRLIGVADPRRDGTAAGW